MSLRAVRPDNGGSKPPYKEDSFEQAFEDFGGFKMMLGWASLVFVIKMLFWMGSGKEALIAWTHIDLATILILSGLFSTSDSPTLDRETINMPMYRFFLFSFHVVPMVAGWFLSILIIY